MRATRFIGAGISALVAAYGTMAALAHEVHYSPEEDLARIDAQFMGEAKTSIDFASYALAWRFPEPVGPVHKAASIASP